MTSINKRAAYSINLAGMGLVAARIINAEPAFIVSLQPAGAKASGMLFVRKGRLRYLERAAQALAAPAGIVAPVYANGNVIGHYDFDAGTFAAA